MTFGLCLVFCNTNNENQLLVLYDYESTKWNITMLIDLWHEKVADYINEYKKKE